MNELEAREEPGFAARIYEEAKKAACQTRLAFLTWSNVRWSANSEKSRIDFEHDELHWRLVVATRKAPFHSIIGSNWHRATWEEVVDNQTAVERRRLMEATPLDCDCWCSEA